MKQFTLLVCLWACAIATYAQQTAPSFKKEIAFTPNLGQVLNEEGQYVANVLAKAQVPGMDMYLTTTGLTYVFLNYEEDTKAAAHPVFSNEKKLKVRYSRVDVNLVGAQLSAAQVKFTQPAATQSNYYFGTAKIEAVKSFKQVTIANVYPGIDWVWHVNEQQQLEYDFVVHPNADASLINMQYQYTTPVVAANFLKLNTTNGALVEGELKAHNGTTEIPVAYALNNNTVSFHIPSYNKNETLVIDPPLVLNWSSQYGGTFADGLRGVATNKLGEVYMAGYSTSTNFPAINPGSPAYWDGNLSGTTDAVVMKIDTAQQLLWATYLGGTGNDFANSVAVDTNSRVYIAGGAETGFPLQFPGGSAYYQGTATGQDAFITRFNSNLQLNWSTFYGGPDTEEALKIHTARNNGVYVSGYSNTPAASFPLQNTLQSTSTGIEGFILRFASTGQRSWASYYGGDGDDYVTSLTTDSMQNLVAVGFTSSTDFPITTTTGAYYHQNTSGGGIDGFMLRFNSSNQRQSACHYGGTGNDYVLDAAYGLNGNYYFTGYTNSTDFPLAAAPGFGYNQTTKGAGTDAFIIRFKNDMSRQWATYYGGAQNETGTGIATDKAGRVYVTGFTFSTDFPVLQAGYPAAYYQGTNGGSADGFIAGFSYLGARFWSTYRGQACYEYANDIAFDNIYNKFYVVGEGLLNCASIPDSSLLSPQNTAPDGFTWAFDGPGAGGCFSLAGNVWRNPCPAACNGRGIAVVTGGTQPVQLIWNNGATTDTVLNLCSGESWVQAMDANGCVQEAILNTNALEVFATKLNDVGCAGNTGSAQVTATFGNTPYQYAWNNGGGNASSVTGIYIGQQTYTVTVTDAGGCTATASTFVDWNNYTIGPDEIRIIRAPSTCNANDGILVAYQNNFPVSTDWSTPSGNTVTNDTLYNVTNGFYSVQGGGCFEGQSYFTYLSLEDSLHQSTYAYTISNITNCSVANGVASVVPNPNYSQQPYTYLWSNGETNDTAFNLSAGNKSVTVTDAVGCSASFTTNVSQPAAANVSICGNCVHAITCQNDSDGYITPPTVSGGGGGPYTYLWSTGDTTPGIYNLPEGYYTLTVTGANGCPRVTLPQWVQRPYHTVINLTSTQPGCTTGGTIVAGNKTNWGGGGPYTYTWSNGVTGTTATTQTNLAPGVYTVTLTSSNNTSYSTCARLYAPVYPTVQTDIQPLACQGASNITATPAGGKAPYSIVWSNGDTGFTTGLLFSDTLHATVTDSLNCTVTLSEYVEVTPVLSAAYTTTAVNCYGGNSTVQITATGGAPAYTGTGTFTLPANAYTYIVTDTNNCADTLNFTITQPAEIVTTVELPDSFDCSAPVNVNIVSTGGTPPYTGTGNFIVTPNANGNIIVTDAAGCADTTNYLLALPDSLEIDITGPDTICIGQNAQFSATGNYSLSWQGNVQQQTLNLNNVQANTTVTVQGISPEGCLVNDTLNLIAQLCVGITEATNTQWSMYPNPTNNVLQVQATTYIQQFTVTNLLGQVMLTGQPLNANHVTLNTEQLAQGVYVISLRCGNQQFTGRFTKQ